MPRRICKASGAVAHQTRSLGIERAAPCGLSLHGAPGTPYAVSQQRLHSSRSRGRLASSDSRGTLVSLLPEDGRGHVDKLPERRDLDSAHPEPGRGVDAVHGLPILGSARLPYSLSKRRTASSRHVLCL